jgi:hypothetical protein
MSHRMRSHLSLLMVLALLALAGLEAACVNSPAEESTNTDAPCQDTPGGCQG